MQSGCCDCVPGLRPGLVSSRVVGLHALRRTPRERGCPPPLLLLTVRLSSKGARSPGYIYNASPYDPREAAFTGDLDCRWSTQPNPRIISCLASCTSPRQYFATASSRSLVQGFVSGFPSYFYTPKLLDYTAPMSTPSHLSHLSIEDLHQQLKPIASTRGSKATFTNWASTFSSQTTATFRPSNVEQVRWVVELARREGKELRASGSGHSPSDLVCTDGYIINLDRMDQMLEVSHSSTLVDCGLFETIRTFRPSSRSVIAGCCRVVGRLDWYTGIAQMYLVPQGMGRS